MRLRGSVRGQTNAEFGNASMTRVEKILLSQMAEFRAEVACDFQMVVDDEADVCVSGDRQNFFRHAPDFLGRRIFCAQLDQIAAAVAQLLRDNFRRAAMQIGRVHEGVKFAVRERFHFCSGAL